MPPIIAMGTWNERGASAPLKPKSRCFVVAEGANTEYWYLSNLATMLSKRNLPERIEIVPIRRTGDDRNKSHPRALIEQAKKIQDDVDGSFGFERDIDRIVAVFDADVYKGDASRYVADLAEFDGVAQVAVTNPSFELFLVLHVEGAVERYLVPHREEILANGYYEGTRRRFISKLANDVLGMNTKSNRDVARLAESFDVAARQERLLNQDPRSAMNDLTSNIALTIEGLIEEGRSGVD